MPNIFCTTLRLLSPKLVAVLILLLIYDASLHPVVGFGFRARFVAKKRFSGKSSVAAFATRISTNEISVRAKASENRDDIDAYDFSTKDGWDRFYASNEDFSTEMTPNNDRATPFEWHSSIPHERVAGEVVPGGPCLVLGCGISDLPRFVHDSGLTNEVTCLDYSQGCLDILKRWYGRDRPGMTFVRGDATRLDECFGASSSTSTTTRFSTVVDKGLTDALMCGEDWSRTLPRLLSSVASILDPENGRYVLVTYRLAASTKEIILENSDDYLEWAFDVDGKSNDRVSFSVAHARSRKGANSK